MRQVRFARHVIADKKYTKLDAHFKHPNDGAACEMPPSQHNTGIPAYGILKDMQ